jgi:glycosyltransferase involved in cell wall biosynthesis
MRIAILADELFAARERSLLDRLEVGLAAEGVRVVHLIPERAIWTAGSAVFSPIMRYADRGPFFARGMRVRRLVRALEEQAGDGPDPLVDVIHAFGGATWPLAMELARQTGAAVALEVWRAGLIARTSAIRAAANPDTTGPIFFAPDKSIEKALLAEHPAGAVRAVHWGVHPPTEPRLAVDADRPFTVVIAGSGQDAPAYAAALEGLATAARAHPSLLVFIDADTARRASLWPIARRLGLLDRLTLVPDMEGRRDLVLRADALILPVSRGEHRTLTLDAMAAGMTIIAAADPWVSALAQNKTAKLVDRPEARLWAAALTAVLTSPQEAHALGSAARDYVRQYHRASSYIAAVLDAYEWLTSDAIPFRPAAGPG